jgi:hypothetical protein
MMFAFDLWRNSATQEANLDTLLTGSTPAIPCVKKSALHPA